MEIQAGNPDLVGNVTNNGYFRVKSPATFAVGGTFSNAGVLNLIGSSQAIPPGTVNTGFILTDRLPDTLTWRGSVSAVWDSQTSVNWLNAATQPAVFFPGDSVVFDDSTTTTAINLIDAVSPASLVFNAAKNFTLGGGGSLNGSATLDKNGSGTLSLTGTNGFTGGTTITAGTLVIANAGALGTGPVTLAGGTWDTGALAPANAIAVTADSTITGGSPGGFHGIKAVSGTGTLTLNATNVFDLEGNMAAFAGTVALTGTGSVCLNGSNGSAAASFNLGTRTLAARNGGTYQLGALTGQAGSSLTIVSTTAAATFSLGGNGSSTTFAGVIANGAGTTHISKTGAGMLTLAGANTYTGTTTVSAGTLRVTGALAATALTVASNATLDVAGSLAISSLQLQASSLTVLAGSPALEPVKVAGNVTLAGTLQVNLAPGTTFGRFPLISHGGTLSGTVALTGVPPGSEGHLAYAAGEVVLLVGDQDEDGLPDTWEQAHFGSLAQSATSDYDYDGTSDLAEYRLGLDPNNSASAFRAGCSGHSLVWPSAPGIVFTVLRSVSLDPGSWQVIGTVTGGAGTTASFTDAAASGRAFYQIKFDP